MAALLKNESRQYTEAAHAEIFSRLIKTIEGFNLKAEKLEKTMLLLATMQVVFAFVQILLVFLR